MKYIVSLCLFAWMGASVFAGAEVAGSVPPEIINYQAEVRVDNIPLTSNGMPIAFRFFDDVFAGTELYAETQAVDVVNGLYSAHIGISAPEGTLRDVVAAGPIWLEVALEGNTLSPRERIASVPYALLAADLAGTASILTGLVNRAGGTIEGPITNLSTITAVQFIGDGSMLTNLNVSEENPTNELIEAVFFTNDTMLVVVEGGRTNLLDLSGLVEDADADPANELNLSLSLNGTLLELEDPGGTLSVDLSPIAAVGQPQIQAGVVTMDGFGQPRRFDVDFSPGFGGSPAITLSPQAMDPAASQFSNPTVLSADGNSFSGTANLRTQRRTPDSAGNVGSWTAQAEIQGVPAISYRHTDHKNLRFVKALDARGTIWRQSVEVVGTVGSGFNSSLAEINGMPAISYYQTDTMDLMFVKAFDADGTEWDEPVPVDTAGQVGDHSTLLNIGGFPAITYWDQTLGALKFVRASAADGSAWNPPLILDIGIPVTGPVGTFTSMLIADGNPAICYYDALPGKLKYIRAMDGTGSVWGTPAVLDDTGNVGLWTSMTLVQGLPAIAYRDGSHGTGNGVKFIRATDAVGGNWGAPVFADVGPNIGWHAAMTVVDGHPAIAHFDQGSAALRYVRALNPEGSAWGQPSSFRAGTTAGFVSMVTSGGSPGISFQDSGDLTFLVPGMLSVHWIAVGQPE